MLKNNEFPYENLIKIKNKKRLNFVFNYKFVKIFFIYLIINYFLYYYLLF
jgi:hypothetical protein